MVLTGLTNLNTSFVVEELNIDNQIRAATWTLLFEVCKACEKIMACIPPSAFSAGRIRETQRNMKISNIKKSGESREFFNTKLMELTPLKYNSKLMNSIWGFYNRYSPHNVKKINDAFNFSTELPQSAGNSNNKNEAKIVLPPTKLDSVWGTINVSQSH
ncbi:uncharacterized protein LOC126977548 [Leptidea sinapis]|uniref:uncharacterized protein LOC126977548 n=1 Tax=Leptidea sinapis TaxID=189913 RepID=UPI0021332AAB|nr:uncharacterized protein LOC126977548 [Leptidea sinapis]